MRAERTAEEIIADLGPVAERAEVEAALEAWAARARAGASRPRPWWSTSTPSTATWR